MPAYEVEHICHLSADQRDKVAEQITKIHTELFSAPALFVNVRFTNIEEHKTYVAGKRRKTNRIFASVRHGPSRTQEHYGKLCAQIHAAWNSIVGEVGERELRAILISGSLVAGWEAGFQIPPAGQDAAWMKEKYADFKAKADEGDQDFVELIHEINTRDAFKGLTNGHASNGAAH